MLADIGDLRHAGNISLPAILDRFDRGVGKFSAEAVGAATTFCKGCERAAFVSTQMGRIGDVFRIVDVRVTRGRSFLVLPRCGGHSAGRSIFAGHRRLHYHASGRPCGKDGVRRPRNNALVVGEKWDGVDAPCRQCLSPADLGGRRG